MWNTGTSKFFAWATAPQFPLFVIKKRHFASKSPQSILSRIALKLLPPPEAITPIFSIGQTLTGHYLLADFFRKFTATKLGDTFKGKLFGSTCATASDDISVYHHAVFDELEIAKIHLS